MSAHEDFKFALGSLVRHLTRGSAPTMMVCEQQCVCGLSDREWRRWYRCEWLADTVGLIAVTLAECELETIDDGPLGFGAREPQTDPGLATADALDWPVERLRLPVRARRTLERLKILTIRELLATPKNTLLVQRNFGIASLEQIIRELARHGLTFCEAYK